MFSIYYFVWDWSVESPVSSLSQHYLTICVLPSVVTNPPPKKTRYLFLPLLWTPTLLTSSRRLTARQSGAMQAISEEDYYKILGVNRKANEAEINKVRSDLCSTALMRV